MLALHGCTAFSLVAVSAGDPLAAVRRLLIVGASLVVEHDLWVRRPQALQHAGSGVTAPGLRGTGSVAVAYGLSCSMTCGIFWTRDQTNIACIGK